MSQALLWVHEKQSEESIQIPVLLDFMFWKGRTGKNQSTELPTVLEGDKCYGK